MTKKIKALLADDDLPLPILRDKWAASLGRFMMVWNILERELDGSFHVLFRTDPTLAVCLYANLQFKGKIDILRSAITMLSKPLGKRLSQTAQKILDRADDLNGTARNTIAHGQMKQFLDAVTGKTNWELVRHTARKTASIVIYPGTTRHWNQQGITTLRLAQRWRICLAKIHDKLERLSLADLEKICLAQVRESEPSRVGRRNRYRPKRPDLAGSHTKLEKWPRT
jgi:hypothetical protein